MLHVDADIDSVVAKLTQHASEMEIWRIRLRIARERREALEQRIAISTERELERRADLVVSYMIPSAGKEISAHRNELRIITETLKKVQAMNGIAAELKQQGIALTSEDLKEADKVQDLTAYLKEMQTRVAGDIAELSESRRAQAHSDIMGVLKKQTRPIDKDGLPSLPHLWFMWSNEESRSRAQSDMPGMVAELGRYYMLMHGHDRASKELNETAYGRFMGGMLKAVALGWKSCARYINYGDFLADMQYRTEGTQEAIDCRSGAEKIHAALDDIKSFLTRFEEQRLRRQHPTIVMSARDEQLAAYVLRGLHVSGAHPDTLFSIMRASVNTTPREPCGQRLDMIPQRPKAPQIITPERRNAILAAALLRYDPMVA